MAAGAAACVSADFDGAFGSAAEKQRSGPVHAAPAHVVVCAFPAPGHVIPLFNLSKLLVSTRYCIVSYVCTEERIAEMKRMVDQAAVTENYSHIRLVALPNKDVAVGKYGNGRDGNHGMEAKLGQLLQILTDMKHEFQVLMGEYTAASSLDGSSPPVCIISDFCLPWTQDVANQFNIPRYVFFPSPAAALCIFMYLPVHIRQGLVPVKTHHLHQSSDAQAASTSSAMIIPGLPPFPGEIITTSLRDTCPKFWQEYMFESSFKVHESAGILINTFHGLEKKAVDALQNEAVINPEKVPIYLVGPLLPLEFFHQDSLKSMRGLSPTLSEEERICVEWLDKRQASSVLYICFGSLATLSQAQIHELAFGLEASGQNFLWVLHPPSALPDESLTSLLPQGFQGRTSKYGLILQRWAPQLLILSHPSVGGFLTHCGWNSTLESACGGVPMLAFPQFAEQHLNCHFVVDEWELGVEVKRGKSGMAERVDIESRVRMLMSSEEGELLRKRAREARETARQAPSIASTHIQMFIQSLP